MKRIILFIFFLLPAAAFLKASAQNEAEAMKNWMEYATPGDMHKLMASWNGTWTAEITMWTTQGAEPAVSTGTAVNKMTMGDRYQLSNFTATLMGMPFEGMSILGYDNFKKVFESTWIDNVGTGILHLSGTWDAATKTMTMKGKAVDPSTKKENDVRQVFKIIDKNTQIMEMYNPDPKTGKEYKSLEVKYTVKK